MTRLAVVAPLGEVQRADEHAVELLPAASALGFDAFATALPWPDGVDLVEELPTDGRLLVVARGRLSECLAAGLARVTFVLDAGIVESLRIVGQHGLAGATDLGALHTWQDHPAATPARIVGWPDAAARLGVEATEGPGETAVLTVQLPLPVAVARYLEAYGAS